MKKGMNPGAVSGWLLILAVLGGLGCAAAPKGELTLRAPTGSVPKAVQAMEEGNRLFQANQWPAARAQYEAAVAAQPTMAEAHYNLALTLERLGDQKTAYDHYIQAANLAPGHKIIWDSPPLRRHGDVKVTPKSDILFMPGLGN